MHVLSLQHSCCPCTTLGSLPVLLCLLCASLSSCSSCCCCAHCLPGRLRACLRSCLPAAWVPAYCHPACLSAVQCAATPSWLAGWLCTCPACCLSVCCNQLCLLPVCLPVMHAGPPASLSSGREMSKMGGSDGGRDSCRICRHQHAAPAAAVTTASMHMFFRQCSWFTCATANTACLAALLRYQATSQLE
jgi:hypothetical protein